MSVRGGANVWAIGDCSLIINAHDKEASPTTGQFASAREGNAGKILCAACITSRRNLSISEK